MLSNRNISNLSSHASSPPPEASRFDSRVNLSSSNGDSDCADASGIPPAVCQSVSSDDTSIEIDMFMCKAYGAPLLSSAGPPNSSPLYHLWITVVHHGGRHYSLPSGSVGRKHTDLLNQELQYFVSGSYCAEWVIVFSSLMLQRDRLVHKCCDIRRLLDCRMSLWIDNQYDVLLQEAICCDHSLRNSHRSSAVNHADHVTRVFTKLMLEGNVRAAVRWVTERGAGGGLLRFSDTIEYSHPRSGTVSGTAFDVLHSKLGLQQIFDSFRYLLEFWYSNSKINIRYSSTYVL